MVRHTGTNDCHKERILYLQICRNMRHSTPGHAGPQRGKQPGSSGGREARAERGPKPLLVFFWEGMDEAGKVH